MQVGIFRSFVKKRKVAQSTVKPYPRKVKAAMCLFVVSKSLLKKLFKESEFFWWFQGLNFIDEFINLFYSVI